MNRPIAGTFKFDSISDGMQSARALHMKSDSFAEGGTGYTFVVNQFHFKSGAIDKIDFAANRRANRGNLTHFLTITSVQGIYDIACTDSDRDGNIAFGCGGSSYRFLSAPGMKLAPPRPISVPVPGGLPLLMSGIAGLAGLRRLASRRTSRPARGHPPPLSSKTLPQRMIN
ncbi:MAG: VPLPA-CTERM sorting domain-containing protein [Roseobacter sp.]